MKVDDDEEFHYARRNIESTLISSTLKQLLYVINRRPQPWQGARGGGGGGENEKRSLPICFSCVTPQIWCRVMYRIIEFQWSYKKFPTQFFNIYTQNLFLYFRELQRSTVQGAIICVLPYQRYANITVWYFFVFSHVPRRYAELLLSAYLLCAGTIWLSTPKVSKTVFKSVHVWLDLDHVRLSRVRGIGRARCNSLACLGMKHDSTKEC
jgi:hypothetical protein